jgi:hypothetical protein
MSNQIEGTITYISQSEKLSDKLTKRFFVVLTDEQYPQELKIEAINASCAVLDYEKEGNKVKVHINLRGRSWQNKEGKKDWFNTLSLWKIESLTGNTATAAKKEEPKAAEIDDSNLPF